MKKKQIKKHIQFYWNDAANYAAEWRQNWNDRQPKMLAFLEGLAKKTHGTFKFHVIDSQRISTNIPLALGDPMLPLPSASQGAHISYDPDTGDLFLKSRESGETETVKYDQVDDLALELFSQFFSSPTSAAQGFGGGPYRPPGSPGWRKIRPKGLKLG